MTVMRECWHACMQRAVQRVMKRDMSDAPLHIVFSLFDANQDGNLASGELVAVGRTEPSSFAWKADSLSLIHIRLLPMCSLLVTCCMQVPCCFLSVTYERRKGGF